MPDSPTPEESQQIADAIAAGRKIEAIKIYRRATGKDLKSAKEFVEALTDELKKKDPEKYGSIPQGKGCGSAAALGLAITLAAVVWLVAAL